MGNDSRPARDNDGALGNPLEAWPNSDLLLAEADRNFFARRHPALAPIFDWPELRALFETYDKRAATARRGSRRLGFWAVAAGFTGLLLAALSSLAGVFVPGAPSDGLSAAAAILILAGFIAGWRQVVLGRQKAVWLADRFCAERLRQFHFQLIMENLSAVAAAARRPQDLAQWRNFRQDRLECFTHSHLRSCGEMLDRLMRDHGETAVWISEAAPAGEGAAPSLAHPSAEILEALGALGEQRLGVQVRYATLKLKKGWYSPASRSRWAMRTSDNLTLVLLTATVVGGLAAAWAMLIRQAQSPIEAEHIRAFAVATAALCSAGVIALRVLNEGLQLSADEDRYVWYLEVVEALGRDYEEAAPGRKLEVLRELERAAYQEMRRFIVACERSRFVM